MKVGDLVLVVGEVCDEEGHDLVVEAMVEDFLEGGSRLPAEWAAQVGAGRCRVLAEPVWVTVVMVRHEGRTHKGEMWGVLLRPEDAAPFFKLWHDLGPRPERVGYREI